MQMPYTISSAHIPNHVCVYVCMCVYMYYMFVCMYICMYKYVYFKFMLTFYHTQANDWPLNPAELSFGWLLQVYTL